MLPNMVILVIIPGMQHMLLALLWLSCRMVYNLLNNDFVVLSRGIHYFRSFGTKNKTVRNISHKHFQVEIDFTQWIRKRQRFI